MKNRQFLIAATLALFATGAWAEQPRPGVLPGHAVATAHPLATEAALEMLQAGGNAFDAAVAASAALAVVEPTGSGLGGGGFWLLHRAFDRREVFVDGRERAPLSATGDMYLLRNGEPDPALSREGPLAAGIPGQPAALAHISRLFGRLPLKRTLEPAIRYARDGFIVDEKLAGAIERHLSRLSPAALEVFAPEGDRLRSGDTLMQADLARTLERLAQNGHTGFYGGETAMQLLQGVFRDGGIWSLDDLLGYRAVERQPLEFTYRGHRIVTAPPPSAGGVALAQVLQALEWLGWPPSDPVLARHVVAEALRRAYRDRAEFLGDPDFVDMPLPLLLSRDYARALADDIPLTRATLSAALPTPGGDVTGGGGSDTTHFSIIDAEGNRVAATLSINLPFGSGYMAPGTGVLLNNEMDDFATAPLVPNAYGLVHTKANVIQPGKRMLSSMTPTFVEGPQGWAVLGTPGGSRIVSMVLLGTLGYTLQLSADDIVRMARFHHQYLPDAISYEPGAFTGEEISGLRALGHDVRETSRFYGNMQVAIWDYRNDTMDAASDPRGVGAARVHLLREPAPAPPVDTAEAVTE